MTEDLAAWLLEQIQADRVMAQDAAADWVEGEDGDEMAGQPDSIFVGAHLVRWRPARVLAECDARRRIIELHTGGHECSVYDRAGDRDPGAYVHEFDTCSTMRLVALPYADRPGYRDEWRPDTPSSSPLP